MGAGEDRDFGWCNVIIKFLLFLTNIIIWVSTSHVFTSRIPPLHVQPVITQILGMALLALGIYLQVDNSVSNLEQVRGHSI